MPRRGPLSGKDFAFPSAFDSLLWRTGTSTKRAAELLRRDVRTVRDWRKGNRRVPIWAFQVVYFTCLDVDEYWLLRIRYRSWVDLRPYFGAPVNEARFLLASGPGGESSGGRGHAVPNPAEPGRTVGPAGAHGRARDLGGG